MALILTAVRGVAGVVGVLAYYVAFFMYEDDEGRWQNRIDKLWVTVDDKARLTGSKTSAFFSQIAAVVSQAFNRVLGRRLFSLRFVGTSTCYSFAGVFLSTFFLSTLYSRGDPVRRHILLFGGLIFLVLAILPSLFPYRWFVRLSLLPLFIVTIGPIFELIQTHGMPGKLQAFLAALMLSLVSDVLVLVLVRFTVRWVSAKVTIARTAFAILIQICAVYFIVLVPMGIPAALPTEFRDSIVLRALAGMGSLNIFTGLASATFVLTLVFVLLHRLLWPTFGRLLYPLARYQVVRNHKIMAAVGTGCFVFAFPLMPSAVKHILEWLGR
jgi:hypothetical protein